MPLDSKSAYQIAAMFAQTGLRGARPGSNDEKALNMTLQNAQGGIQGELQKEAAKEAEKKDGVLGKVGSLAGGTVGFMVGGPAGAAAGAAIGGAGGRAADGQGFDVGATAMDALGGYAGAKAIPTAPTSPVDPASLGPGNMEGGNALIDTSAAPATASPFQRAQQYLGSATRGSYMNSVAPQFSNAMWGGGMQDNRDGTYSWYPSGQYPQQPYPAR